MKSGTSKFEDYRELSEIISSQFDQLAGNQPGDTQKGVNLVIDVVKGENGAEGKEWPSSLLLGSDAVDLIRKRCEDKLRELSEWEKLSRSTDL